MAESPFPVIEDVYQFQCTMCGNCCTGDQIVRLDLYDLYRMARFSGFEKTGGLFTSRLVELTPIEPDLWLPRIRFRKHPFKFCPFLQNEWNDREELIGKCLLHPDQKPLVCSLAPVGRMVDFNQKTQTYVFVPPAPDCPGINRSQENYLKTATDAHRRSIQLQDRFFAMMERLKIKTVQTKHWYRAFYNFNVQQPVTAVFASREVLIHSIET
ncbi:MAG: hypothetical protein GF313_08255 [Caldithrix sp.]|nr:hypothetical protein [Caldithrix sp.]